MTEDLHVRTEGRAGRITLARPRALNAMTYAMCTRIEAALDGWRDDPEVALVILDAEGDKAFCAGGDIAELYATGTAGDYEYGRRFWRDEYRLNAKIAEFPKPVISFMQGFTMGGGVGLGCHASMRVVGETSQIAMPECGIGLVPDIGGSFLLARAPGRLGAYLGLTGARMGAGDAIHVGFADLFLPEDEWQDAIGKLAETGAPDGLVSAAVPAPAPQIDLKAADRLFAAGRLEEIRSALEAEDSPFAQVAAKALARNAPLSMACTLEILRRLRETGPTIRAALELEYRFTHRAMQKGDFLEGIRAQIIDKDRNPKWQYPDGAVPDTAVAAMLTPLGTQTLTFGEEETQ